MEQYYVYVFLFLLFPFCFLLIWNNCFTKWCPVSGVGKAARGRAFHISLDANTETILEKKMSPDNSMTLWSVVLVTQMRRWLNVIFKCMLFVFSSIDSWCTDFLPLSIFGLQIGPLSRHNRTGLSEKMHQGSFKVDRTALVWVMPP